MPVICRPSAAMITSPPGLRVSLFVAAAWEAKAARRPAPSAGLVRMRRLAGRNARASSPTPYRPATSRC